MPGIRGQCGSAMYLKSSKQQERNYEEANRRNRVWRCRYARHSHYFIRAKRSPDRRLPVCDGRRSWQSGFCTHTSSVRSYGCSTQTSHDQAPQKDLYVSEALKEWLLTLLTRSGGPGFRSPGPFSNYHRVLPRPTSDQSWPRAATRSARRTASGGGRPREQLFRPRQMRPVIHDPADADDAGARRRGERRDNRLRLRNGFG
jgi:hypothetical protein